MIAIGLDPDMHTTGVGIVRVTEENRLICDQVSIVRIPHTLKGQDAELAMVRMLAGTLPGFLREHQPSLVVAEAQWIYPHSPARPNDILRLARMAGAAAACCMWPPRELMMPLPQEWKGTVPKEIHQARMMGKLHEPLEFTRGWPQIRKSDRTHVLDAVALAIWGLLELKKPTTRALGTRAVQSQSEIGQS